MSKPETEKLRERIDNAIAAEIRAHCPEGKWVTGPATLHLAIGEAMEELLGGINPPCPECGAGVLFECVACSATNYPATPAPAPDANVEAVRTKLMERSRVGLAKYGVTTERGDLSLADWLRHMQEELLDGAVYIEAAIARSAGWEG